MVTVIDSLIVTLGLKGDDFKKGMKEAIRLQEDLSSDQEKADEAARKRGAEQDAQSKRTAEGYRKIRNEVLSLAAVFTAGVGIKNFLANTIDSAINLGYLSQNLSMSTERIKAFQMASERAGGSQEGLAAQLKESVETIAEFRATGGGPNSALSAFFRWGGSEKDLENGNTLLLARSKIIHDMFKVNPGAAMVIAREMGVMDDQFNFFKGGPEEMQRSIDLQKQRVAITEKDAAGALVLKNKWLDFTESLQSMTIKVLVAAIPALTKLMELAAHLAEELSTNKEGMAKWITELSKFITDIKWEQVKKDINEFAADIKSLTEDIKQLAETWKKWTIGGKIPSTPEGVAKVLGANTLDTNEGMADRNAPPSVGKAARDFYARTLAFFGSKDAAAYIRDTTGKDDYNAGPASATVQPKSSSDAATRLKSLEAKYGLPGGTLDTIWKLESQRGNPKFMKSPAGAMGHFGFMPGTAKEYGLSNPNDFDQSSDSAARKMRDLLKEYKGDFKKASAAYNFGQGNLARTGMSGLPGETRNYVQEMSAGAMRSAGNGPTNKTSVQIDNITVHTKATDAAGIARSMRPAVEEYMFSGNANTGVTP